MARAPYNRIMHDVFVQSGMTHTAHEEHVEDVGDAESGPDIDYSPGWDEYTDSDHRAIIDHEGRLVHWEKRDLAFEAWVDQQAIS